MRKIEGVPKGTYQCTVAALTEIGSGDKPKEKVTIVESGEIPIELEVDADGAQIPLRACVQGSRPGLTAPASYDWPTSSASTSTSKRPRASRPQRWTHVAVPCMHDEGLDVRLSPCRAVRARPLGTAPLARAVLVSQTQVSPSIALRPRLRVVSPTRPLRIRVCARSGSPKGVTRLRTVADAVHATAVATGRARDLRRPVTSSFAAHPDALASAWPTRQSRRRLDRLPRMPATRTSRLSSRGERALALRSVRVVELLRSLTRAANLANTILGTGLLAIAQSVTTATSGADAAVRSRPADSWQASSRSC